MGISENESYLDSLLKAVMEPQMNTEPEPEQKQEEVMVGDISEVIEEVDLEAEVETGEEIPDTLLDFVPEMPEEEFTVTEAVEMPEEEFTIAEATEVSEEEFTIAEAVEVPEEEFTIAEATEVPEEEFTIAEVVEMPEEEFTIAEVVEMPEEEFTIAEAVEVPEEEFTIAEVDEVPEEEFTIAEVAEASEEEQVEAEVSETMEEAVSDIEYMEMPEFIMDADTAKEVEALLNISFDESSISEMEATDEIVEEEPEIEFVPEEVSDESSKDVIEVSDFVMDADTAKEVEALLNADFDVNSIMDEKPEEPIIEFSAEDTADLETEISDDLLDEDIENLLGMETIETDDSELLGDVDEFYQSDFDNDVEMIVPTVDGNQFSAAPSLEEMKDMSQDDIESLLKSTSESSVDLADLFGGGSTEVSSEDDLLSLLAGGADDVADADELLALLGEADGSEELSYIDLENDSGKESAEDKKTKKAKKSKKKSKKRKDIEEAENTDEVALLEETGKKQGAFRRFMDFLMEEDEEESKAGGQGEIEMTEEQMSDIFSNVSDENKEIIKELDKEEKKKKKRKKKGKKEETEAIDADEDEIEAKPTGKPKKQKKPKKEKRVKLEEYDPSAKKLSKKKVGITFGLIATIMVAILVVNYLYAGAQVLKKARNAYYAQDYATCYETLYGKKMTESDEILFNRSSLMLRMSRSVDAYEGFMAAGMPVQALDSLIQGIGRFEALRMEAVVYELEQEAEKIYTQLVDCLGGFGLSEQKALEIYNSESDEAYTNQLIDAVKNGTPIIDEEEEAQKEYLYDALPVEEEIN